MIFSNGKYFFINPPNRLTVSYTIMIRSLLSCFVFLFVRYDSVNTGRISVVVKNLEEVNVNIHSSGVLTGSFLNAIIVK